MKMLIMPVANGVLPRPNGGKITGIFFAESGGRLLSQVGFNKNIMVCPWVIDNETLYPIGVVCRIKSLVEKIVVDDDNKETKAIMAVLEGQGHARWHNLEIVGGSLLAGEIEPVDFKGKRKEYPVISSAGWFPEGGYTECKSIDDIPVSIYGIDLETNRKVSIEANLGGLVTIEKAHTLEHSIIRALQTFGICSAKTLIESMQRESHELKQSIANSIRWARPEMLGITGSGMCGNPMTNLAQFYLAKDFVQNVQAGKTYHDSLQAARKKTMSKLSADLNWTMNPNFSVMQGLKKGMHHDDSNLKVDLCKKIIARFPFDPWQ